MAEAATLFEPDPDYVPSDAIAKVAAGLIRRHKTIAAFVEDLRVIYCERLGEPSGEGEVLVAQCQKASPIWRDVAHVDVVIWVWTEWWECFSARQREAVVLHELCHVGRNAKGGVKLRKHDVEEFSLVVAQYGVWDDFGQLGTFMRALLQHEVDATKAADGPEPIRLPAGRERRRPGTRKAKPDQPPVVHP